MKAGYSLSDCANYSTNQRGDCGGPVRLVMDTAALRGRRVPHDRLLCENCRNRTNPSTVQSD